MDKLKKNNHYIPKFYLKRFSNNGKSVGMYHNKSQKIIANASITSNFTFDYLYGKDNKIENALMKVEGHWSKLISKIIDHQAIPMSNSEYQILLQFILVSRYRTLLSANINKNVVDSLNKNGVIKSQDVLEKISTIPSNAFPLKVATESSSIIADLEVSLIINKSSIGFITSDNPVCLYNSFYEFRQQNGGRNLYNAGIQIFMPISPKLCLYLVDEATYETEYSDFNQITLIAENDIHQLNLLFASNSFDFFIFNDKEEDAYIMRLAHECNPIKNLPTFEKCRYLSPIYATGNYELSFCEIANESIAIPLPNTVEGLKRPLAEKALNSNIDALLKKLPINLGN